MRNLNITLFGDYFVGNSFSNIECENIYKYLSNNDLNIINYEGAFGKPMQKAVPLIMSEKSLDLPKNVILSLSNNHVFDGGYRGFQELKQKLDLKKITYYKFTFFHLKA